MRKILITSALTLILSSVTAQLTLFTSSLKLVEKADYVNAEKKVLAALAKTPADLEENYAYALLLSKKKYTGYNTEKAYEVLTKTISLLDGISDEKEIKKLAKIPLTITELDRLNDTICYQASEAVIQKNDFQTYEKFLAYYVNCPAEYKKLVVSARNVVAFTMSSQTNTIESYQDFINKYPDAVQLNDAIAKRDELAFMAASKADKIAAYEEFTTKYPDAVQKVKAITRIHELAFDIAKKENKASTYDAYMTKYPASVLKNDAFALMEKCQFFENTTSGDWLKYAVFTDKFPANSWVNAANDSIYKIAMKTANLEVLSYCVQKFTGDVRKNALLLYHDVFTMDGEKFTMDMFHSKFKDDFLAEVKARDNQIVILGDELKLGEPYTVTYFTKYDEFIRMAAPRDKAVSALQNMIRTDIDLKNWAAVQKTIETYSAYFGSKNKKFNDLVMFVSSQNQQPAP